MRELAAQYPRYGYRRIRIFLRRHGHAMSTDRAYRLWRIAGLQLPRKRRVGVLLPAVLVRCLPAARTKSGRTTLCSTHAPTVRISNA